MQMPRIFQRVIADPPKPQVLDKAEDLVNKEYASLSKVVAQRAYTTLGYSPLLVVQERKASLELMAKILQEAGVKPYPIEMVNKFKEDLCIATDSRAANRRTADRSRWDAVNIAGYTRPVPEHVLLDAISVKETAIKHDINAEFIVEEMNTKYDPILSVRIVDRGHNTSPWVPIAIWDEPTFKG